MRTDRAIAGILGGCVLLVLALGIAIRRCTRPDGGPAPGTPTPSAPATPTVAPAVAAPPADRGHRLAGTVVGDVRYAIVEHPGGNEELYRPGQMVPGLGRLLDVAPDGATFAGDAGTFELRIAAAPTPTAKPTEPPPRRTATPASPSRRGRSKSESSPSDESDRSAS